MKNGIMLANEEFNIMGLLITLMLFKEDRHDEIALTYQLIQFQVDENRYTAKETSKAALEVTRLLKLQPMSIPERLKIAADKYSDEFEAKMANGGANMKKYTTDVISTVYSTYSYVDGKFLIDGMLNKAAQC